MMPNARCAPGSPSSRRWVGSICRRRIGTATGLVVVDLIGAGVAQEHGVVGETPNLAARLQGLAGPGTLIVADATRQ
jgi:class 3 adenylate cyclase